MWKMAPTAGTTPRVLAGRRLVGSLRRGGFVDLRDQANIATVAVTTTHRGYEDLEGAVAEAYAGRDLLKAVVDDVVRDLHFDLSSVSRDAAQNPPCSLIFVNGFGPFVRVDQAEQKVQIEVLIGLCEEHLPPEDPVRVARVPELRAKLDDYLEADEAVTAAEKDLELASRDRDTARAAWDTMFEQVWAALVAKVGAAKAERYFPPRRSARSASKPASQSSTRDTSKPAPAESSCVDDERDPA